MGGVSKRAPVFLAWTARCILVPSTKQHRRWAGFGGMCGEELRMEHVESEFPLRLPEEVFSVQLISGEKAGWLCRVIMFSTQK